MIAETINSLDTGLTTMLPFSNDLQKSIVDTVEGLQKLLTSYAAPAQQGSQNTDIQQLATELGNVRQMNISLYTALEPINETMSKGRVRIFYKGLNRNRTFISEDFANQLIESLPYTPVKGIFDKNDVDYTDHGEKSTEGRIYGLVMADPNFAWEDHLDEDGITRTYACADVLYYTGLYPEATLINGSSQSMEIFKDTLKGEWKTWEDGLPYYHFYSGCLLGLQVLGMSTEPCFEGAAFYSLQNDLRLLISNIKNYNKKEANAPVERTLFRLSDNDKAEKISMALNPNFNEEGNWEMSSIVLDVYEDYALIGDIATGGYKRAYYSKDGDNIVLGDVVDVKIVDVSETEYNALEAMKAATGTYEAAFNSINSTEPVDNTEFEQVKIDFEKVNTELEQIKADYAAAQEKIVNLETSINEMTASSETIQNELNESKEAYANLQNDFSRLQEEKDNISNEKATLAEFKANVESSQKEEILNKFATHLTDEMVEQYRNDSINYTVTEFEKEVCTAAYKNDSTLFSRNSEPQVYPKENIFDDKASLSPVERLIENYKRGGNK